MTTSPELMELQTKLVGLAQEIASGYGLELDFSLDSIKTVSKILENTHDEVKRTGNTEGIQGIALEMAAYIVTAVERNSNDSWWERDHVEFGPNSFPFHIGEKTIFPLSWCLKQIESGAEDDVSVKFNTLVLPLLKMS